MISFLKLFKFDSYIKLGKILFLKSYDTSIDKLAVDLKLLQILVSHAHFIFEHQNFNLICHRQPNFSKLWNLLR